MQRSLVAVVTGLLVAVIALPASAAIRITKVQYDPPGSDTGSNSSLNAEWVKIKNTGDKAKSLRRWKLRTQTTTCTSSASSSWEQERP
jgi:hypothetical protein